MQLNPVNKNNIANIRRLYRSAFPLVERKPFSLLLRKARRGQGEFFAIESDQGDFLGLANTIFYKDMVMLDYFATAPQQRNGGIGSAVLTLLHERYDDRRLFGEIEVTDKPHPELELRRRRRNFYLRNGFTPVGMTVSAFSCEFEVISNGKPISFEEYKQFYYKAIGPMAYGRVKLINR